MNPGRFLLLLVINQSVQFSFCDSQFVQMIVDEFCTVERWKFSHDDVCRSGGTGQRVVQFFRGRPKCLLAHLDGDVRSKSRTRPTDSVRKENQVGHH